MTVAGKGGRPRKWRSDADRVRAFRARERGEAEPPTIEQALLNGDELARALNEVRQLEGDLEAAKKELKSVRSELARERRTASGLQRRVGWIEATHAELVAERDSAVSERQALQVEVAQLQTHFAQLAGPKAPPTRPLTTAPEVPALSRAERRRLERERQRRRN